MTRLLKKLLFTLAAAAAGSGWAAAPVLATFGNPPLYFEADCDQSGTARSFLARGSGCSFFVAPTEAALTLAKFDLSPASSPRERGGARPGRITQTRTLRFEFVRANSHARISGNGELPGKVNYLIGSDPARWRVGLPLFARVRVENIYPGVDLVYYGNQQRLEYDFVVSPHSDPGAISIRFSGADKIRIDAQGDLVFSLGGDEIQQPKPVLYQIVDGARKEVTGGYRLVDLRTVAFQIGDYDRERPLVIDPVLSYSTYFGGTSSDIAWDNAVDANGFVYLAGETMSAGLATPGAYQTTYRGGDGLGGDAFVAKFDNLGANLLYLTYLGGKGDDAVLGLAVDGEGHAYATGFTSSPDFPTANALRPQIGGPSYPTLTIYPFDAFVAELGPSGSNLVFSTYLGGAENDEGIGIALDAGTNVYVTGFTSSTNFPTAKTLRTNYNGNTDAFVTKLSPHGTAYVYSLYLGGTNNDQGEGIAADLAGHAYVAGLTSSTNFPTTNAIQTLLNGTTNYASAYDVFLTKLTADGSNLVYSTYFGGAGDDIAFRLRLDDDGNVFITGSTTSLNFPTNTTGTNFVSGLNSGNILSDIFVTKFGALGTNVVYSVVFGGSGTDAAWDVAVDRGGNAHLVGLTYSSNLQTTNTSGYLSATNSGSSDVFISVINPSGSDFVRSAYLGGSGPDNGYGIKVDAAGNDYLVGATSSTNFPTVAARQPASGGTNDAFFAKIVLQPTLAVTPALGDVIVSWPAFAPEYQLQSNTNLISGSGWLGVPTPPVLIGDRQAVLFGATNDALFFRLQKP